MTMPQSAAIRAENRGAQLYRMLWRWHFYAGLLCIPFVLLLAATGSIYLFKPQIEAAIDRPFANLSAPGPLATPSAQVAAAVAAVPGSQLSAYQLPRAPSDAVQVIVSADGDRTRVYLHPHTSEVLKVVAEEARFMAVVRTIHGELLMGDRGSLLVEIAASWAIVMIVTGLYLWWPRNARGLAGVLWPRLMQGPRTFWRDLHAVTGMWISGLALVLLLSGLPWTQVWGDAFKKVRAATGLVAAEQSWTQGRAAEHAGHAHHDHEQMAAIDAPADSISIDAIVETGRRFAFAAPVVIQPPSGKIPAWVVRSQSQNHTVRREAFLDPAHGATLFMRDFSDRHVVDQAVMIGISMHEGQLFGWLNQALGLIAALGLATLSVSAFVMWRLRKPAGALGAPPAIPDARIGAGLGGLIFVFAIALPMLGATLVAIALIEVVVLRRIAPVRRWLGLRAADA